MALQILPQIPQRQSFGSEIGGLLGSNLGTGLAHLANRKLQEIAQEKQLKEWQTLGIPLEEGRFIMQQSPALRDDLIRSIDFGGLRRPQEQSIQQPSQEVTPAQAMGAPLERKPVLGSNKPASAKAKLSEYEEKKAIDDRRDYLNRTRAEIKAFDDLSQDAEDAIKILKKNKDKLPNKLLASTDNKAFNALMLKPEIRTLQSLYAKIAAKSAAQSAAASGFRSGKALLDAAERSKAAINQDYQTQLYLLENILKGRDNIKSVAERQKSLRDKNGGRYPLFLEDLVEDFESGKKPEVTEAKEQKLLVGPKGPYEKDIVTGEYRQWNPDTQSYSIILGNPNGKQ